MLLFFSASPGEKYSLMWSSLTITGFPCHEPSRKLTAIDTWKLVWFRSLKLLSPRLMKPKSLGSFMLSTCFRHAFDMLSTCFRHAFDMLSIHGDSFCESIALLRLRDWLISRAYSLHAFVLLLVSYSLIQKISKI